jgi:hypothetical protein
MNKCPSVDDMLKLDFMETEIIAFHGGTGHRLHARPKTAKPAKDASVITERAEIEEKIAPDRMASAQAAVRELEMLQGGNGEAHELCQLLVTRVYQRAELGCVFAGEVVPETTQAAMKSQRSCWR